MWCHFMFNPIKGTSSFAKAFDRLHKDVVKHHGEGFPRCWVKEEDGVINIHPQGDYPFFTHQGQEVLEHIHQVCSTCKPNSS